MAVLTGGFGEDVFVWAGFLEQWSPEFRVSVCVCVCVGHACSSRTGRVVFVAYCLEYFCEFRKDDCMRWSVVR